MVIFCPDPSGSECRGACSFCHNDTVSLVLTSHFPNSTFSGNAQIRKFVPIRKTRVKYFKRRPSEHIRINIRLYNYTLSNAKKLSSAPIHTVKSTCDWLRTDASVPPYRRVRTLVVVRPYENRDLFSFFRARRSTIPQV